jgi:hypothetical protein
MWNTAVDLLSAQSPTKGAVIAEPILVPDDAVPQAIARNEPVLERSNTLLRESAALVARAKHVISACRRAVSEAHAARADREKLLPDADQ